MNAKTTKTTDGPTDLFMLASQLEETNIRIRHLTKTADERPLTAGEQDALFSARCRVKFLLADIVAAEKAAAIVASAAGADPIPDDPLSPDYFAWSVRRRVREGGFESAIALTSRLRTEANELDARATAAEKALEAAVGIAAPVSQAIDALKAFRWIAQAMTPNGCEGPAPIGICDLPFGGGPDWPAMVALAERAIADPNLSVKSAMQAMNDRRRALLSGQAIFDDPRQAEAMDCGD